MDKKELAKRRVARKAKRALLKKLLSSGADRMAGIDRDKGTKPTMDTLISEPVGFLQIYGDRLREFTASNPKLSEANRETLRYTLRTCAEETMGLIATLNV